MQQQAGGAYNWGQPQSGSPAPQQQGGPANMPAWQKFSSVGGGLGALLGGDGGALIGAGLPMLLQLLGKGDAMSGIADSIGAKFGAGDQSSGMDEKAKEKSKMTGAVVPPTQPQMPQNGIDPMSAMTKPEPDGNALMKLLSQIGGMGGGGRGPM